MSDDVLSGAVRDARTAVGDNLREPCMIRTIHGYGYQFVAVTKSASGEHKRRLRAPYRPTMIQVALVLITLSVVLVFIVLIRSSSNAGSRAMPSESAWFKFDEPNGDIVFDSSANQNSGRIVNGVRRVSGVLGSALEFDGNSGYLVGNSPGRGFPKGDAPRTVACWIRTEDRSPGDRGILHWGTASDVPPRSNFHLFLSGGRIGWGNGYGQGYIKSEASVADGRWHYVVGIYSGPPLHSSWVYLDTNLVAEATSPIPSATVLGAPWRVGIFLAGGTPFKGTIDDLRIFPGALSMTQIKALYSCGFPEEAYQAPVSGRPWFVPLGLSEPYFGQKGPDDKSIPLENRKDAFEAVEFASSDGVCAVRNLGGVALPEQFRIAMDVELPGSGMAGPFLDAPPLSPADSPIDGKYPADWVALDSDGFVTVRPLERGTKVLARSGVIAGFDRGKPHHLVIDRMPDQVRIFVDGNPALKWTRRRVASGRAAGVAFEVRGTPLFGTPQRVRNIVITPVHDGAP